MSDTPELPEQPEHVRGRPAALTLAATVAAIVLCVVVVWLMKPGNNGSDSEAIVTIIAAITITSRLDRVASSSAPAGVCATMPAIVAIDMTRPMRVSSHRCSVKR